MNQRLGKRRLKALRKCSKPADHLFVQTPKGSVSAKRPEERELTIDFAARHYFPDDRHYELENALIGAGMAAPLLKEDEMNAAPLNSIVANTASTCIEFVRASLEIDETLYVAVSSAASNALAVGSARCFVISLGLVSGLSNLIINLYQSKYFRDIWGSPTPIPPLTHTPTKLREQAISELLSSVGPVDLIPQQLLAALMAFCVEFTSFHELGHLIDGHLTLTANAEISEASSIEDADQLLTRRALEMDADAFAVQQCLTWAKMRADTTGSPHGFLASDHASWTTMIVAIFLVVIAMDRRVDTMPQDYRRFTHPPPHIRSFGVLAVVNAVFDRWRTEHNAPIPADWGQSVLAIRGRLEAAIADIGESTWDPAKHERWMNVIVEHDTSVLARYAKLRDQLEKGKLGKRNKLAPAQLPPD